MFDYKKIIRCRDSRIKLMQMFNWIPDRVMLSTQYFIKTGRWINWKNPRRFTEKIQLYKIYSKNNLLMSQCADKADVRTFVANCGLSDILIPLIGKGVFDSTSSINWDELPNRFVMKDTLGSGGNSVIVCHDKTAIEKEKTLSQCDQWTTCQYKHAGREHVYDKKKHRIIIESYLDAESISGGLVDYKFFCFEGKVKYIYAISNRDLGLGAELGIYDKDFNIIPYTRMDERAPTTVIQKPDNFARMCDIAEKLAEQFPEVRVDLYNINGKIYFGEMTFFDGSGYMRYNPDEFDYMMGECFKISI